MNFNPLKQNHYRILILFSFIFLVGCSKSSSDTTSPVIPPPVTPPTDSVIISLKPKFNSAPDDQSIFELIVSTAAGTILLDTQIAKNTNPSISFKSPTKLVDVTLVDYTRYLFGYNIVTYKSINPSNWDTLNNQGWFRTPATISPFTWATLDYINSPQSLYYDQIFFNSFLGSGIYEATFGPTYAHFKYQQRPNPVFLSDSRAGLYKLYSPVSLSDTVDLSSMDTLINRKMIMNDSYNFITSSLVGILDTTLKTQLQLYNYSWLINSNYTPPDIQYPNKYFQKYQLSVDAKNTSGDYISHFSYGDTVAWNFNFPTANNYTLSSVTNNDFSVKFNGIKPSYYSTMWKIDSVNWVVYNNPDSVSMKPLNNLSQLQSRISILESKNLNALTVGSFGFVTVANMSYPDYWAYTYNSSLRKGRFNFQANSLTKTF
jgi:hypothetical protein